MPYEIAEVLSTEPHNVWNSDNGPIHYFKVRLTDGTEAEAGKKEKDGQVPPPQVGDKYEKLRKPNNPDYLPTLQKPITDYQGGKAKDFHADPKKLRSENARSALHAAKDLVVADKIKFAEMAEVTGKLYDYIESKAKVDS